jgi:hypothetical protein
VSVVGLPIASRVMMVNVRTAITCAAVALAGSASRPGPTSMLVLAHGEPGVYMLGIGVGGDGVMLTTTGIEQLAPVAMPPGPSSATV